MKNILGSEGIKSFVIGIILLSLVLPFLLLGVRLFSYVVTPPEYVSVPSTYAGPGGGSSGGSGQLTESAYTTLTHSKDKLSDIMRDFEYYYAIPHSVADAIFTKTYKAYTNIAEVATDISNEIVDFIKGYLGDLV